jgi:cellulose biosynthesis protein BcsQ
MRTFLVASSKGGAGKTTLATNLAAHYALEGKRIVLVDADRQHSATRWGESARASPAPCCRWTAAAGAGRRRSLPTRR